MWASHGWPFRPAAQSHAMPRYPIKEYTFNFAKKENHVRLSVTHPAPPAQPDCPQAGDQPWGLLRLPPDAFELVWRALGNSSDQFALRASCKGAKQASAPFITNLVVQANAPFYDDEAGWEQRDTEAMLRAVQLCLSQFPSDAVLKELRLYIEKHDMPYMVAPGLLPGLFFGEEQLAQGKQGSSRLANIEKLKLHSNIALTVGDTYCISCACPQLSRLQLVEVPLIGPVLQPLTGLRGMVSLSLCSVRLPQGPGGFGASLSQLSQLTYLRAIDMVQHDPCWADRSASPHGSDYDSEFGGDYSDDDEDDDDDGLSDDSSMRRQDLRHLEGSRLCAEEVLAHIQGLPALRELHLQLQWRSHADVAARLRCLSPLRCLPQLSALTLGPGPTEELDEHGNQVDSWAVLRGPQLLEHSVGRCTSLVSLCLPDTEVEGDALDCLLGLNSLTQLEVGRLSPSTDLSARPCSWRSLLVQVNMPSLSQLQLLPLHCLEQLQCDAFGSMCWDLKAGDVQGTAQQVGRGAQLLARAWLDQRESLCELRLSWDRPCPASGEEVVEALAPLNAMRHPASVGLCLSSGWQLGEGLAGAMHQALPQLHRLRLSFLHPGFEEFVGALARQQLLRGLRHLHLVDGLPLTSPAHKALLGLALARCDAALPLLLHCPDCTNSKVRGEANRRLWQRLRAKGLARDAVKFVGSGYQADGL